MRRGLSRDTVLFGDRHCYSLTQGGVYASREPVVIRTTLGSCIAVCLLDVQRKIGGMNHFMLPGVQDSSDGDIPCSTRYGVHAMELLINECMRKGADRYALVAKVFGGGHVLSTAEGNDSVPNRNIRFIQQFLADERIPVLSSNTGGHDMRKVYFLTDTGRIYLKRSPVAHVPSLAFNIRAAERTYERKAIAQCKVKDEAVTLFE